MERALLGESFPSLPQLMTLNLFYYLYLLGVGKVRVCHNTFAEIWTSPGSRFSSFTMCVPGMELKLSGLVASTSTHWATLMAWREIQKNPKSLTFLLRLDSRTSFLDLSSGCYWLHIHAGSFPLQNYGTSYPQSICHKNTVSWNSG